MWRSGQLIRESYQAAILACTCVELVKGPEKGANRAWVQQRVLVKREHPGIIVSAIGKAPDSNVECGRDAAILVKLDKFNPW
jgi:hypothetical protein